MRDQWGTIGCACTDKAKCMLHFGLDAYILAQALQPETED